MKVRITNLLNVQQYIDLNGDGNPDTLIILGGSATTDTEVTSERRFVQLSKEFKDILLIRKV